MFVPRRLLAFLALAGTMALMAVADVPLQLWRHHSGLRMTLEELREESRETEGDPKIKSQIRSRQREMARRRMMQEVPKADVVVTNPTHFSVALLYRDDRMRAPIIVAKGSGPVALRIREIAAEHGVPRLEAPPLARALHRHAEIGEEVPAALYGAVAQVLAYVFQLKKGIGPAPLPPQSIPVPPELDPGEVRA
jgi:flagellar biosynthetic protein FlhB